VANYNVDIAVALKGAEKLRTFSKQIKDFGDNVKGLNIFLQSFSKGNDGLVRNISNLQKNLSDTAKNFKEVALDTKEATIAAAQYAKASDELNKGLAQQQKLLDDVSGKTAKKTAADNKTLQEALLKLETKQTRNLEEKFETQQKFQKEFKDEINKINQKRKEENKLIKQNVEQTKKTVAEEIKKKFSIIASHKERRKNFNQSLKELRREQRATAQQIPINDRINAQLRKRGLILSSNGKQIIRNNQNRRSGMGGGLGNAIGSGIIGGGFPLLFGQGATAALGGGIGGVAGGLIGGQFGFALSIAGTTIGSTLDQLSKALLKPTENIEMLVNRLGLAGTETGDLALELEKLGLTTSAAELLLKEFETEFGLTADDIKENAETLKTFNNEINKLGTSLTLMMSDVLNPLIKELNNLIKGKRPEGISRGVTGTVDFFTANALDLDKRGQLLDEIAPILNPTKPPKLSNIPPGEQTVNNPDFGKPGFVTLPPVKDPLKPFKDKANQKFQTEEIIPLKQALEIEQKRLTTSADKLNLMQQEFQLINLNNELEFLMSKRTDEVNKELDKKIEKLKIARDTQAQVVENTRKLIDPFKQLSNIIAVDIGNGIKGLIQGTQSLNDILRNVTNKIADAFLNMAIFGNFGGGSVTGGLLGAIGFANGGRPPVGRPSIVGEKGAELFVPDRAGTIIPNHELGGSTNIVVNVDASGSNVEGDEEEGRELGRLISVAIQSELIKQKRPGGMLA
jgi:methyl-accepting chemotaxis protein